MEWFQFAGLMATVVGCTYYAHRDLRQDMAVQSARSDRLYEMFIDLLKDKRS
jgi:hypothetical protein